LKRNPVAGLVLVLLLLLCFAVPAAAESQDAGIHTFEEVYDYIRTMHISKPDPGDLMRGAVDGMIDRLEDPYTEYLSPEDLKDFSSVIDGDYVGVGVQLLPGEEYPEVTGIIENSPASKSDIRPGDLIIRVDGADVAKESLNRIVQKIRGPENTKVRLTIRRKDVGDFEVELVRSDIDLPTVNGRMLSGDIGYVRINTFGYSSAKEFERTVADLVRQGADKIMMDLRDNPGGVLQSAVNICGNFVDTGTLVVSTVDRNGGKTEYRTEESPVFKGLPVAVLINTNSASASEILAGALQDYGAALLLGSRTYGKGTVQAVIPLEEGGALKLTVAKYYTPKDRVIDGAGLVPDRQVLTPDLQVPVAMSFLSRLEKNVVVFDLEKNEVQLNGNPVPFRQKTFQSSSGEVYLPLRFVFEALGYRVDWRPDNSVMVTGNGSGMIFNPGDGIVSSGGRNVEGAEPLLYEDGTNYVPVSDLTLLGLNVKVDGGKVTVEK